MKALLLFLGGMGSALLYFSHLYGQLSRLRKGRKALFFWHFPVRFLLLALFLGSLLFLYAPSALYLVAGLLAGRAAVLYFAGRKSRRLPRR